MEKRRVGLLVSGLVCVLGGVWWLSMADSEPQAATIPSSDDTGRIPWRALEEWVAQRRVREASPPPPTEPAVEDGLRVRVVDSGGAPLRATLHARFSNRVLQVATTDEAGAAHIVWRDEAPLELVAESVGFAPRAEGVDLERERELTLVLSAANQFHGRVVRADGTAVGADAVVLVCPTHRTLSRFGSDESWMDDPEILLAVTDAAGRYVVDGVDPQRAYDLLAGGRGWVQEDPQLGVRWTAGPVDLVVLRGYGTLVQLRSQEGNAVGLDSSYGGGVGFQARARDAQTRFAADPRSAALLSGIVLPAGTPDASEQLYIVGRDDGPDEVFVDFSVGPPGFDSISAPIQLEPLDAGLSVTKILLSDRSAGRGELTVKWDGGGGITDSRLGPIAVLSLTNASGQDVLYPWMDSGAEELRLKGVPFGSYRAQLQRVSGLGLFELDVGAEAFEVGPSPAILVARLRECGGLEFRLREPDGSAYCGEWGLFIGRGHFDGTRPAREVGFAGGQVLFRRPPYSLAGLEPGDYSLRTERPTFAPNWVHAQVSAGGRSVVEVVVSHDGR